jgi:glycosyltransferase involved in cell wall biosynthesis
MKLLFHGTSPEIASGYGTINKLLLEQLVRLRPDLEITVLAMNDRGDYKDHKEYPYKIYPANALSPSDIFGLNRLNAILDNQDPHIQDIFDIYFYSGDFMPFDYVTMKGGNKPRDIFIRKFQRFDKRIIYTPIDSVQLKKGWVSALNLFQEVIVPTNFAKKIIKMYDPKLGNKVNVIPYGIDTENFYKRPKSIFEDRFVVGFVGKNQFKKDIGRLVKVFNQFRLKNPDKKPLLFLHTNYEDQINHFGNLVELMNGYGMVYGEDYYFPKQLDYLYGIPRKELSHVYNEFDVFMTLSVGEGFCLPVIEAMLCKVPVIAHRNSALEEIVTDRGLLVDPTTTHIFGEHDFMRERPLADIKQAENALQKVVKQENHKIIAKAHKFAKNLTAEKMAKAIELLIPKETIGMTRGKTKKQKVDFYFPTKAWYNYDGYGKLIRTLNDNLVPTEETKAKKFLTFGTPAEFMARDDNKHIIFTMFEADRIPERWVVALNKYDHIITPSRYCIDVFRACGVTTPMSKVHLFATDFEYYNPDTKPFIFSHQNSLVKGAQKGWDLVIRAFLTLYKDSEDVQLVLKARSHEWANEKWYYPLLKKQKNIEVIIKDFTDDEMQNFYKTTNCFVYPSRGEGFGLPPVEAMAHGIPTILTRAHSHTEFSKYGIEIGTTGRAFSYYNGRVHDTGIGWWVEPSIDELIIMMKRVHDNYKSYKEMAKNNKFKIESLFNTDKFVKKLLKVINNV